MTDRELVGELQEFGLTRYQSEAYVATVELGRARPSDLVDASDVPQGRIYDVLSDLEDAGLVEIRSRDGVKEVVAPSPTTVLDDVKRRRIDELNATVDSLSAGLERLHGQRESESESFVTMVSREETALRHTRQAIESADWWLTLSLPVGLYERLEDELSEAVDRGVTVRVLTSGEEAAATDRTFPSGLQVRYRATADTFVAADRSYGIFSSKHPTQDSQPYIITREPNLVLLMQNHAETIWASSRVIRDETTFPRRYLDPWRVIIHLRDELESGRRYHATIEGQTTDSQRRDSWTGTVTGIDVDRSSDAEYLVAEPTVASLQLTVDGEEITVGGWKATLEDVAASGIELRPE